MIYTDAINTQVKAQSQARDALLRRVLTPAPVFTLHDRQCEERLKVEKFVAEKFHSCYGASIDKFMPELLSMRCLNNFSGVIGMRKAANASLYLEKYLDSTIEESLSLTFDLPVNREEIVELGNLVAGRKGPSQFVFLIATSVLHEAGYKWITFTATQSLANNLNKLGFPTARLAEASVECLPDSEASEWGSYYETKPQVYAGNLDTALAVARKRPLFRKAMALYRRQIKQLARELNEQKY